MEKEAVNLYRQLYKSGYEKGCYNLGLYMEINENYDEAERYYKKSADKGHVKSQYRLAYLYDEKNFNEDAIEYYLKSIEYITFRFRIDLCFC